MISKKSIFSLLALVALAGCSVPQPPTVYWPAPPNQPRLQWIDTVYSEDDFPKTSFQVFKENFMGKPPLDFFRKPIGIAADGKGKVFVSDMDAGAVKVFDYNDRKIEYLTREPIFKAPIGMAVDRQGRIYVADGGNATVLVFAPDYRPLFTFGGQENIKKPAFLAINERLGRIYVTDSQAHKVVVFDLTGKPLFSFGERGDVEGAFFAPMGVAVNSQGEVYVSDMLNARIQAFTPDGKFLRTFGMRGNREGQFENPRGLGFDSEDNLYIVDGRKSSLSIYRPDGTLLLNLGGQTTDHPLGFAAPIGLWVDSRDRIYIADLMNRRFTMWQYLSPTWLREHPLDRKALEELEEKVKGREKKDPGV